MMRSCSGLSFIASFLLGFVFRFFAERLLFGVGEGARCAPKHRHLKCEVKLLPFEAVLFSFSAGCWYLGLSQTIFLKTKPLFSGTIPALF
jgi:hypothetical protein